MTIGQYNTYRQANLPSLTAAAAGRHITERDQIRQDRPRNTAIKTWRAQWENNLTSEGASHVFASRICKVGLILPRYSGYCTGGSLRQMRARGRGRRWPEGSRASHGPVVARIVGQGRGGGRHRDRRGGAVGTAIDRQGGQGQTRTTRPLPPDRDRCIRYRRAGHRRMGDGYWWRQHARRCCAMRHAPCAVGAGRDAPGNTVNCGTVPSPQKATP
jgi:hypothetical protein